MASAMRIHRTNHGRANAGCVSLCGIVIIALAITIICLCRYQLYNVYGWCTYYPGTWWTQCYAVANTCWFSTDPYNNMGPCQYLYSLGSVALFWQFFISMASCAAGGAALGCMSVFGFCNFGWWLAGAIYFNNQVKLVNDTPYNGYPTPAGNYRDAVNGVNWAAFAMSVVQLIAIGLAFRIKDDDVPDDKLSGEMAPVPQAQPVYHAPPQPYYPAPAPAAGYPAYTSTPGGAPPPAGYAQAPPPAGYGAPPPPAGAAPYPAPPK